MNHNLIDNASSDLLPLWHKPSQTSNPSGGWHDCFLADGWRVEADQPPIEDGYERTITGWIQDPDNERQCIAVYTDELIADRDAREAAAEQARQEAEAVAQAERQSAEESAAAQAELDRQASEQAAFVESVPKRVMYNQYMLLCKTITGSPDPIRLGMSEVQGVLLQMVATASSNPETQMILLARESLISQYLMALQVALSREAGIYWWESCEWCDVEPVTTIAQANHDQMMGALPA